MDTEIDVLIESGAPAAAVMAGFMTARTRFARNEQLFSRFLPGSLLSRLNAGETVTDPLFATVCRAAIEAHEFTAGLFNPMVLPALEEAGYRETFARVAGGAPSVVLIPEPRGALRLEGDSVALSGGRVDLGGIVKGWTVDTAAAEVARSFPDVMVNAGGDIRAMGHEAGSDGWEMAIERDDGASAWEGTLRGAMATSSVKKRSWRTDGGGRAHHLIDPRTGIPSTSAFVQVTVWAAECWVAECWAKAVVIGGEPAAVAARAAGCEVLAFEESG